MVSVRNTLSCASARTRPLAWNEESISRKFVAVPMWPPVAKSEMLLPITHGVEPSAPFTS